MRKVAKNISSMPQYKKMMADFLAREHAGKVKITEIVEMLAKGHRGYLAMSEDKLSKLFDKHYDKICDELVKETNAEDANSSWMSQRKEDRIKVIKERLQAAEAIYDEIFEKVFL